MLIWNLNKLGWYRQFLEKMIMRFLRLATAIAFLTALDVAVARPSSSSGNNSAACENLFLTQADSKYEAGALTWTKITAKTNQVRRKWRDVFLADPNKHDPSHFRYLIRGRGYKFNREKFQRELADITNRSNLSMSLVDQSYMHTFMGESIGFVMRVPPENILASNPVDMGGGEPREVFAQFGLHTPDELIAETKEAREEMSKDHSLDDLGDAVVRDIFNEVRVSGTVREKSRSTDRMITSKVEVVGLFYTPDLSTADIATLEAFGSDIGLPVIRLVPVH